MIRDFGSEDLFFLSNFDHALLGVSSEGLTVYQADRVIDFMINAMGDETQALDKFYEMSEDLKDNFVFVFIPVAD